MKDYYSILGVPRGADQEEIKRAYRRLARRYHPDVNKDDHDSEAKFKEISEAYEVLGNEEKRRRYDLYGEGGLGPSIFERGFDGFGSPFSDLFDVFFGRGASSGYTTASHRGSDLMLELEIDLEEAYLGTSREIQVPRHETCGECGGSGLEKGYGKDLCPDCGGDGRITHTRRSSFGTFSSVTTCRRCKGTGEINTHPCSSCEGKGVKTLLDTLKVEVPAGVSDGDRVRIKGKGEAGTGGAPPGDLYVEVRIREHDTFVRRGDDLLAEVNVSMAEAALGTEIDIPTLDGVEKLRIPPGSQPGTVFRLRGRGMPRVNSRSTGDLYLSLNVNIPRKLTAEQRKLLEEFHRIESQGKGGGGFIHRLRKAMRPQS